MSEEFFNKIADIFKKGLEEKGIKDSPLVFTAQEYNGIIIGMPRKAKDISHGSSYEILCNRSAWCKIKGDIVSDPDSEYTVSKSLEESGCKIFSTHRHIGRKEVGPPREESHLHFICEDKDRDKTIRMIRLLKDY